MEILLAVAVATVAVASCFIAARFRTEIREQAARTGRIRKESEQNAQSVQAWCQKEIAEIASHIEQAESTASAKSGKDRRDWLDGLALIQRQVTGIEARLTQNEQDSAQNRRLVAAQQSAVEQLQADLAAEARDRGQAAQQLEQRIRGELADELSAGLERVVGQYQRETATLKLAVREAERRADVAATALGAVRKWQADHLQSAEQRLAEVARDIGRLDQRLTAVQQHIRRRLSLEAAPRGAQWRILPGGIQAGLAGTLDVFTLLYENLCQALELDIISWTPAGPRAAQCYLVPEARSPAVLADDLEKLLRACPAAGETGPGLAELRSLLLAVHHAGPAALQLGPMVVTRMDDQFAGYLLAPDAAADRDPGRFVDLESWASSYGVT